MNGKIIAIMGTGPLALWTAEALLNDSTNLQIRMGNTRGTPAIWLPPLVTEAEQDGRLSWHAFDAMSLESMNEFSQSAEVLIHCAIPDYHLWITMLPTIQRNAIEASLVNNARLICADNLYAYEVPSRGLINEDTKENPPAKKGQLRKDILEMMRRGGKERDLQWATIQSSQYFGPGATNQSVFGSWFVEPLLKGKPSRFVGKPNLLHSWAYAPDFGRAMALLATSTDHSLFNRSWIIPHVSDLPAADLAVIFIDEAIKQGFLPATTSRKVTRIPRWLLRLLGVFNPIIAARDEMLYQFVVDFQASGEQLTAKTGFQATPLDEAVSSMVQYWRETKAHWQ